MKILVDADACPVKQLIIKVARQYNLPVVMFIDTSHILEDEYAEIVTVDRQRDSADFALANRTAAQDVVVTQDYGLAAMVLAKGALALNQNGMIYSGDNMDRLLFERHLGQKVRRAGGRTSGPRKRTKEDDIKFETAFRRVIQSVLP